MGWLQDLFQQKKTPTNEMNVQQWNSIPFMKKVEMQRAYNTDQNLAKQGIVSPIPARPQPVLSLPKPDYLSGIKKVAGGVQNTAGGFKEIMGKMFQPKANAQMPVQPSPTPTPAPYRFDPSVVGVKIPKDYTFQEPTGPLAQAFRDYIPKEATQAAVAFWAENATHPYDPEGYNFNTPGDKQVTPGFEGSGDYGPGQINSKTLTDYLMTDPKQMAEIGVSTVEDLKNPIKAVRFAKIIKDHQGWGAWKGWKNKGIEGL
jgi:hypothetical protein